MVKTTELLTELDTFLTLRENPTYLKDITTSAGHIIRQYQIKGVELKINDRVQFVTMQYYVYREGESQEQAYYIGDPIGQFWRNQVHDFLAPYNGQILRASRPLALAKIIETAVEGEKYILVTETSPGVFIKENTTIKEFEF